jgi:hypothetical protein
MLRPRDHSSGRLHPNSPTRNDRKDLCPYQTLRIPFNIVLWIQSMQQYTLDPSK